MHEVSECRTVVANGRKHLAWCYFSSTEDNACWGINVRFAWDCSKGILGLPIPRFIRGFSQEVHVKVEGLRRTKPTAVNIAEIFFENASVVKPDTASLFLDVAERLLSAEVSYTKAIMYSEGFCRRGAPYIRDDAFATHFTGGKEQADRVIDLARPLATNHADWICQDCCWD